MTIAAGCPECAQTGQKPRRIWGEHHYDAHGGYHEHGPNGMAEMHCSNGHTWTVDLRDDCSACSANKIRPQT